MKPKIFITAVCIILIAASTLAQKIYNVEDYGAIGDGKTDNIIPIQKEIDACNAAGGGQVLFHAAHI